MQYNTSLCIYNFYASRFYGLFSFELEEKYKVTPCPCPPFVVPLTIMSLEKIISLIFDNIMLLRCLCVKVLSFLQKRDFLSFFFHAKRKSKSYQPSMCGILERDNLMAVVAAAAQMTRKKHLVQ